jgi:hypothetical protein
MVRRAFSIIALETCTSRTSKSNRLPSASIADVPTIA